MKKNYKQTLSDLESGLTALKNLVKEAKDRVTTDKALKNIPIQEARIDGFKDGYALRNKELKDQTKLSGKVSVLINVRGKKTPDHLFLRVNRGILKTIPDEFYMDLTIENVRNGGRV